MYILVIELILTVHSLGVIIDTGYTSSVFFNRRFWSALCKDHSLHREHRLPLVRGKPGHTHSRWKPCLSSYRAANRDWQARRDASDRIPTVQTRPLAWSAVQAWSISTPVLESAGRHPAPRRHCLGNSRRPHQRQQHHRHCPADKWWTRSLRALRFASHWSHLSFFLLFTAGMRVGAKEPSRMQREQYNLKAHCCWVCIQEENQHFIFKEHMWAHRDARTNAGRRRRSKRTEVLIILER